LKAGVALEKTAEAPRLFREWIAIIAETWDFETICFAHRGVLRVQAKQRFLETVERLQPLLDVLEARHKNLEFEQKQEDDELKECSKYNVEGSECG